MKRRDTSRALLLLALSLLTFVSFVGRRDIVTSHEARVVQTARQMAEAGWPWNAKPVTIPRSELVKTDTGEKLLPRADGATMSVNPWIVPIMNGQVRLQKPPLPYWVTAFLYRTIGVSEFASRIIPALLGAISVLLVWDLARMLLGRVGAIYAALVWTSSYFIVDEFRKAMADPYLALFSLATIWAWLRSRDENGRFILLSYAMLALGILAKGPIIFLFVPTILILQRLCSPRLAAPAGGKSQPIFHVFGIFLLLLITLPWALAVVRSVPNVLELWRFESLGALNDKDENARPFWFYLPNLFFITLPWTPVWILGLLKPFKKALARPPASSPGTPGEDRGGGSHSETSGALQAEPSPTLLPEYRARDLRGASKHPAPFNFPARRRFAPVLSTLVLVIFFSIPHPKKNAYLLPLMPLQAIIVAEGLRWLTLIPRRRAIRIAILRTTITAVSFAIATQIFLSGFRTAADNARSPRPAAAYASSMVKESNGNTAILYSRLPDEVTAYLPLQLGDSPGAKEYLLIADDRNRDADETVKSIPSTPAGRVTSVEPVAIPDSAIKRWKLYRLRSE